jgi:hypothetical protein
MNLVLMIYGYPITVIKTEDKENYFRALRQADGDNLDAFVSYIAQQVIVSQELWLKGAREGSLDNLESQIASIKDRVRVIK